MPFLYAHHPSTEIYDININKDTKYIQFKIKALSDISIQNEVSEKYYMILLSLITYLPKDAHASGITKSIKNNDSDILLKFENSSLFGSRSYTCLQLENAWSCFFSFVAIYNQKRVSGQNNREIGTWRKNGIISIGYNYI